jgi:hypothetical protein
MTDRPIPADMLAPSVDPKTKKLGIRTVTGRNDAGTRTEIKVRHFDIVATDEPDTMGGTNTAPSPLENVLVSLVGCDGVIIRGVVRPWNFLTQASISNVLARLTCVAPKAYQVFSLTLKKWTSKLSYTPTNLQTA